VILHQLPLTCNRNNSQKGIIDKCDFLDSIRKKYYDLSSVYAFWKGTFDAYTFSTLKDYPFFAVQNWKLYHSDIHQSIKDLYKEELFRIIDLICLIVMA